MNESLGLTRFVALGLSVILMGTGLSGCGAGANGGDPEGAIDPDQFRRGNVAQPNRQCRDGDRRQR